MNYMDTTSEKKWSSIITNGVDKTEKRVCVLVYVCIGKMHEDRVDQ